MTEKSRWTPQLSTVKGKNGVGWGVEEGWGGSRNPEFSAGRGDQSLVATLRKLAKKDKEDSKVKRMERTKNEEGCSDTLT